MSTSAPSSGYNVVIFVGKKDAEFYEHIFARFPIHYCLAFTKKKDFVPTLRAEELVCHHPFLLDDIDWNTIAPLDEALIEQMRPCEARAIQMCERLEKRGYSVPYQERKRLYLQMLRFCNHILTQKNINLAITTDAPHHSMTYITFSLCRAKGIPFLFPYHVDPLADVYYLQEEWEDPAPELAQRYKELHAQKTSAVTLSPTFEAFWNAQTGKKTAKGFSDPTPWYMSQHFATPLEQRLSEARRMLWKNPMGFLWHVLTFLPRRCRFAYIQERFRRLRWRHAAHVLFRFYETHTELPDLSRRYVYVPLQIQPEATTLPMGGAYVDQQLVVEMLEALLPPDVLILVKEHPQQRSFYPDGQGRSLTFYENLLACKKVRFVPCDFNTYRLTENAVAVATVTGTAGFEALFREKPVLLFGHRFYQYAAGVFMIRTAQDCAQAVRAIFQEGFRPRREDMRIFLKAIEETAIEGSFELSRRRVSRFSMDENAMRAGAAFAALLERKFGWHRKVGNIHAH